MIKLNIQTLARRGTDIQAYVDPMWSHHEGSMSIPRANLRWAHVDCRRRTHEVNVGGQHRAHVGPTYHCYQKIFLKKLKVVPLFIRLMTPNGVIWSLDQRTVIMR